MDVWRYEISLQVLEKTFNKGVQQMSEIFFMSEQSIFLKAGMLSSVYYINTNEIYYFTIIF